MTIALIHSHSIGKSNLAAVVAKAGRITLAVLCFAMAVILVLGVRTFSYLHFHGDDQILPNLIRVLTGAFAS